MFFFITFYLFIYLFSFVTLENEDKIGQLHPAVLAFMRFACAGSPTLPKKVVCKYKCLAGFGTSHLMLCQEAIHCGSRMCIVLCCSTALVHFIPTRARKTIYIHLKTVFKTLSGSACTTLHIFMYKNKHILQTAKCKMLCHTLKICCNTFCVCKYTVMLRY